MDAQEKILTKDMQGWGGIEGKRGGGGGVSQNRRDLLPGSPLGLAQVLHRADIKKKEISMPKGDVSTEENEAATRDQQTKCGGVPEPPQTGV